MLLWQYFPNQNICSHHKANKESGVWCHFWWQSMPTLELLTEDEEWKLRSGWKNSSLTIPSAEKDWERLRERGKQFPYWTKGHSWTKMGATAFCCCCSWSWSKCSSRKNFNAVFFDERFLKGISFSFSLVPIPALKKVTQWPSNDDNKQQLLHQQQKQ